jgi:short-subunit dehydrogenase
MKNQKLKNSTKRESRKAADAEQKYSDRVIMTDSTWASLKGRSVKADKKTFVVTGAGSGIGRELTLLLLSKGANVAGVDINPHSLAETGLLAGQRASRFEAIAMDVTNRAAVEGRLPERIRLRFGPVDGVINNAGIIQPFVSLMNLDYAIIERVLNVNLLGTIHVTKVFLPHLIERPEAHIVNLSSMGGFIAVPGQTIYCAAKAAVKLLSEGLASELMDTRVRVTVVFPGAVATNISTNSGIDQPAGQSNAAPQINAMPAAEAARIIIGAMERNARDVYVGQDSSMMSKLHRLNPNFATRTIAHRLKGLLTT